jgi:hypothetical protein
VLLIAATQLHSINPPPVIAKPAPQRADFPPAPPDPEAQPKRTAAAPPALYGSADAAIDRIANWATLDADPLRRAFVNSGDLYAFVQRHLARAVSGDGAASYYIYLALDECRPYLRIDADEARSLAQRMQPDLGAGPIEERQSWFRDGLRCSRFAGGDLSALVAALGEDRPGAEAEYGSVLFERAANAGFPPAVAERALREPGFDASQRDAMLRGALRSANADVYWQLFRHSWSQNEEQAAASLAWLIEACRKGYDCGADASWFRVGDCADGSEACLPAQSALAHYWYAAPVSAREAAFVMAQQIDTAIAGGRFEDLPLPQVRDLGEVFAQAAVPIEE